ncbi:MAG TPA: zinc-binding alcohol dehydrogenase [Actinomycetota bacterium]|nr:zinc-binding alcohol dehydrogenase [Actinomycetota bacterium]
MRFVRPRQVEIVDIDIPEARAGEVLVRTRYSGISGGTEMLAYRGELHPTLPLDETIGALGGTFAYPFQYGYSCVGEVIQSRTEVREGATVFVLHPHQDLFVTRSSEVVDVGGVNPRVATLFPLVETALQVSLDAEPRLADAVIVTGLGAVGILSAAMLARAGARVVGSEPKPWRREIARSFGVTSASPDELEAAVKEISDSRGVDLLVEASGNPNVLAESLHLLRHQGTALVASWYGTKVAALPLGAEFHRRRLTIRSSQVSTIPASLEGWDRARRRAVARSLIQELPLELLATHEFSFEEAPRAYAAIDQEEPGLIHAALRYP